MNRIFLVGYFARNEAKMELLKALPEADVYILEASNKVQFNDTVIHAPQRLSGLRAKLILKYFFKKVEMTAFHRSLFRRDLIAYYSHADVSKPISKERRLVQKPVAFLLYCFFIFRKVVRIRFANKRSFRSAIMIPVDFVRRFELSRALSFSYGRDVRTLLLKIAFASGYHYYEQVASDLKPNKHDYFLNWGTDYSGNLLLGHLLKGSGAKTRVLEFGELPGTVSIGRKGIFGESDIALNWDKFSQLEVEDDDMTCANEFITKINRKELIPASSADSTYWLHKNEFNANPQSKPVVYVNGSELIASGHIYNRSLYSAEIRNPNAFLLDRVLKIFDPEEYIIIYKDHPMAKRQSKNMLLDRKEFHGVVFADGYTMGSILDMASVVISFPSKVVMTSIMLMKPTIVVGNFTLPAHLSVPWLLDESAFNNIELLDAVPDNLESLSRCVARMLKYSLVKIDSNLYDDVGSEVEQQKVSRLLA